jgi:segregation and condensation protein B
MSHRPQLEAAVEAILFVTAEPVPLDRLLSAFDEGEREEVRSALDAVRERYGTGEDRGVRLEEVAGGLRIVTAAECHPYLRRYFDVSGAHRLSMAALETLAIVAYRQPVTGPEIQELRGKNSATSLRTLLERRLIRIAGRKEVVGRPFLYGTTREFLMHFGLRDLSELPPLEEFEEAFGGGEESAAPGAAISHEHERIGLVSTDEAEASLGSHDFAVHDHVPEEEGAPEEETPG